MNIGTVKPIPIAERFWKYVHKTTGCWIWKGSLNKDFYGVLYNGKWAEGAHRISWRIHFPNRPIAKSIEVLHKCDNPPCVNPFHLFLGTQTDNIRDMIKKGRAVRVCGEKIGLSKITDNEANKIRALYTLGCYTQTDLAHLFSVTQTTISCVVLRKTWKHIGINEMGAGTPEMADGVFGHPPQTRKR